jgi:hypothetical protein
VNTNALAKLYDRLTPLERLPLIIAATDRGDNAEADRLARSAPRIGVSLPDYYGLGDGLMQLSSSHMIAHLDLILEFWLGVSMVVKLDATGAGKKQEAERDHFWSVVRMVAYRICVGADAWRRLCGELKIGPETLLRRLPGYQAMQRTEEAARLYAFTSEEAVAYLRQSGGEGAEPPTVEESGKAMRDFIDQRVAWWG